MNLSRFTSVPNISIVKLNIKSEILNQKYERLIQDIPKIKSFLLYISLFFVRLPPFYLLPTTNSLFTSHSIARYLIIFIFFLVLLELYWKKTKLLIPKKLTFLLLFYLISQSLSITKVININDFLLDYKNVVFGLLTFIIVVATVSSSNVRRIIIILLITGSFNILFNIIIYFFPNMVFTFLQPFFYDKYWDSFIFQFQRQRFFSDMFDEILIPLLFFIIYIRKRIIVRLTSVLFLALISMLSLLSNWRIKMLILIFGLFFSSKLFIKKSKTVLIAIYMSVFLFLSVGYIFSISIIGFNTLDRFLFKEREDVESITSRFKYWELATSLASYFPITGIGLGNYLEYVPEASKLPFLNPLSRNVENIEVAFHPHNIFFNTLATSGFLGLLSFSLLIFYFLKTDLYYVKKASLLYKSFLIVFWSLFLYGNFVVPTNFSFQFMFWFIRGIIQQFNSYT